MGRWATIASWIVPPLGMSIAYTVLAITSNTDTTGRAWMALGFVFVVILWLTVRVLVEQTALPRAMASGDSSRLFAITERKLARRTGAARAPFLVHRAYAFDLERDHARVLEMLDGVRPAEHGLQLLAAALRVLALAETGEAAAGRRVLEEELEPLAGMLDGRRHETSHVHARLARGRLLLAEGNVDEARAQLQRVVDDVRAGTAVRERARALMFGAAEPARGTAREPRTG